MLAWINTKHTFPSLNHLSQKMFSLKELNTAGKYPKHFWLLIYPLPCSVCLRDSLRLSEHTQETWPNQSDSFGGRAFSDQRALWLACWQLLTWHVLLQGTPAIYWSKCWEELFQVKSTTSRIPSCGPETTKGQLKPSRTVALNDS